MREFAHRARIHALWKLLGISAFMWPFFMAYFHMLRHPVYPVTVMPLTPLDRAIPFQPQWLLAYVSLWLYTGIAPGLLLHMRELLRYGLWAAGLCLSGLICFYFWPTAVPELALDLSAYPGFGVLQGVDAAGNACPSLHVAAAVFSAFWIDLLFRKIGAPAAMRLTNLLWLGAIVYSTLAIKQHVVLDALAGTLLGTLFALVSMGGRWHGLSRVPNPG
jgi:hypothetical protein